MTGTADAENDVPYSEDLQNPSGAASWVEDADRKRPLRLEIRRAITTLLGDLPPGSRVLELGSGPGLLAEQVLGACRHLGSYTLLDFSEPMLEMSRARLARTPGGIFVLEDFRSSHWMRTVDEPYDAIVSMQAAHEVRHKRRIPVLFAQAAAILVPSGLFLMCDRVPEDDSPRSTTLFMTAHEQEQALLAAGFDDVRLLLEGDALALYVCRKPGARAST